MRLTQEERAFSTPSEEGEWKRIPEFHREAARYREAARAKLRKDKRVNNPNGRTRPCPFPKDRRS